MAWAEVQNDDSIAAIPRIKHVKKLFDIKPSYGH
jgi:hypothetical protein